MPEPEAVEDSLLLAVGVISGKSESETSSLLEGLLCLRVFRSSREAGSGLVREVLLEGEVTEDSHSLLVMAEIIEAEVTQEMSAEEGERVLLVPTRCGVGKEWEL